MAGKKKRKLNFTLLMIGLVILGVWLMSADIVPFLAKKVSWLSQDPNSLANKILHSFGEALAIAAILGLTVDSFVKRKFAKEVASDVSAYMAANQLPHGIQEELASLSMLHVYRDNFRVEFHIDHRPGDPHIKLKTTIRFTLVNVVDVPYEFTHVLSTTRSMLGGEDTRQITHVEGPGYAMDATEGHEKIGEVEDDELVFSMTTVVDGKSSENYCATIEEAAPLQDTDSIILTHAARNISVQVISPPHVIANVDLAHRKGEEFTPSGDDGNKTWDFGNSETAMLPTQAIYLQWRLKEEGPSRDIA